MSEVQDTLADRVLNILAQHERSGSISVAGEGHDFIKEIVEALTDDPKLLVVEIPEGISLGDLWTAQGAIFNASTSFVDWDELRTTGRGVDPVGFLLLDIARQLEVRSR